MKRKLTALLMTLVVTVNTAEVTNAAQWLQTPDQTMDQEENTGEIEQADGYGQYTQIALSATEVTLAANEIDKSIVLSAIKTADQTDDEAFEDVIEVSSSDESIAYVKTEEDGTVKLGNIELTARDKTGRTTITFASKHDRTVKAELNVYVKAPRAISTIEVAQSAYNKAKISFSGDAENAADGYILQQKKDGEAQWTDIKDIKEINKDPYDHIATGLVTGIKYSYRVKAYVKRSDGTYLYGKVSSTKSIKTRPDQVKNVKVKKNSYNKITVSWDKVAGATEYWIYRSDKKAGTYSKIAKVSGGSKVSYTDSKILTGINYYYKVRALRTAEGITTKGEFSTVVAGKSSLDKTSISAIQSKAYNKVTVSWKKVSGADGYKVYCAKSKNGTYSLKKTVTSGKTTQADIGGLSVGKTYYFKVRAYRTVNKTKKYGEYSAVKSAKAVCAAPKVKATPVNASKITVSWGKVAGAQYYTVSRSTSKNGKYEVIKKKCTALSYTNKGLTDGKTYYYKVYAYAGGSKGKLSSYASARSRSLTVLRSSVNVHKGEILQLSASTVPSASFKWSSSNKNIATVSSTGLVTGIKNGKATVTVKANGFSKTIKVNVTERLDGIDVSKWQGDIDWNAVAASGRSFAMLRAWHTASTYEGSVDEYFETNYKGARAAGIKTGCYAYSTAQSIAEVEEEARNVLKVLNGRKMEYPVVLDMESARTLITTNKERTDMVFAFKSIVENAGYKFALYANTYWLDHHIDNSRLKGVDIWVARYKQDTWNGYEYQGGGNVVMWQYSNTGSVPGINGNVDLDFGYKAY